MPDLDKIERQLLPGWRSAYKLVKGGHSPEEVARAALKALAENLRLHGGAPGLYTVARAVQDFDAGSSERRSFAAVIRQIEHGMASRNGKLVAAAGLSSIADRPAAALRGTADVRVARDFCKKMIEHQLFARSRDYLVGKGRFHSRASALELEGKVYKVLEDGLERLARRLAKDPSARRLRAPSIRHSRRRNTGQLLNEPLW